jgi:methionyl-tRNA formyltransferase
MDTGPIFLCAETPIDPEETVSVLSERLAILGSELTIRTIQGIVTGTLHARAQDERAATAAPILRKSHGFIDWRKPAESICNQVRAFNPWPGTVSRFRGTTCKILKCRIDGATSAVFEPGSVVAGRKLLAVQCGNSVLLEILEIQPENRKAVSGREFVNGARIQTGEKFDPVMDN